MRFRALGFTGLLLLIVSALTSCRPPESTATLQRETYVWQRAHTGAVADSVRAHAPAFDHVSVLAAEVSWPTASSSARVTRVPFSPASLEALKTARSLGLAIRINAFSGSFAPEATSTRELADLTRALLTETRDAGLVVNELQLDFDASEKRLADYAHWLKAVRAVTHEFSSATTPATPVRLTFTALPAWLGHRRDFSELAALADSYVLQVHSLTRPKSPEDPTALCDPAAARRAVVTAAHFKRPFRVALPTYGYRLAFNPAGKFFALSAEGPAPDWPAGTITRELSADPAALAALVSEWSLRHPAALTGIIWYRLPVAGDRLNWTWPTLDAVMRGETPSAQISLEARASTASPGLVDYVVVNSGNAPFSGSFSATVTWSGATRVASDVLPPFALETETATSQSLTAGTLRLAPGARQSAGWLRLHQAPLSLHVSPSP